MSKHRHKAQLPVSKLMRRIAKQRNRGDMGGMHNTTGDMIASSEETPHDPRQYEMLDSMFQASNQ